MEGEEGKKITLEQAAVVIGVPKSTLDDYFIHIKLAEKYGFDFEGNFQRPFQVVRKFVK